MTLRLSRSHLDSIQQHAEAAYPYEGCGLLLGSAEDGLKIVRLILPVENTREPEAQHNRYLIPPEAVRRAEQVAADQGLDVVGFFHSHPDHPAAPSDFDREHAWPWYTYLITSVEHGQATETTAWTLAGDRQAFMAESMSETI